MKRTLSFLLAACLLTFGAMTISQAYAMDVATAKKQGLVGEQTDGMLGIVFSSPSADLLALVETTNAGRLAVYKEMAEKQGLSLAQMKEIAATKIYDKEAPGNYIQINGEWSVKRLPR